ncbi:hypothetical protein [Alkalihalophilus marmarensis]|uniref:Phage protein n=1 Tax=Alkalihalophilus marmarensis DSM 21297 TaxID=1188261 RepID=U6SUJ3_9BACI|nr:hypothetical protein [Alkalihalophilus marmarensis]ERN54316.1 hypothetical protein A33I_07780 [Alkalihalophilus marmarensis DSM 21297]
MKIKVGHIDYEYTEVEIVNRQDPYQVGECDYINRAISIDKTRSKKEQGEIFLHELIHSIDEYFSIGLKEKQVKLLGHGLSMAFRDNPSMQKLFVDKVGGKINE